MSVYLYECMFVCMYVCMSLDKSFIVLMHVISAPGWTTVLSKARVCTQCTWLPQCSTVVQQSHQAAQLYPWFHDRFFQCNIWKLQQSAFKYLYINFPCILYSPLFCIYLTFEMCSFISSVGIFHTMSHFMKYYCQSLFGESFSELSMGHNILEELVRAKFVLCS